MSSESRRSKRHTDFTPVSVYVKDAETDSILAGPFPGRIVDICSYGACLLMSQVSQDSFHVFHTTRERSSSFLEIKVPKKSDAGEIVITARPVWLNTFQRDDFLERMVGVEFIDDNIKTKNLNII